MKIEDEENMNTEISKTIVYENGDTMNIDAVRKALFRFWKMTKAEKRCLLRMIDKYPEITDHPKYIDAGNK